MSKGRILVVLLLVGASVGAYFPPVKSEQSWLSGRETFIYKDNFETSAYHISEEYFIYATHKENENPFLQDITTISSLNLQTGETIMVDQAENVAVNITEAYKLSGNYLIWQRANKNYIGELFAFNLKNKTKIRVAGIGDSYIYAKLQGNRLCVESTNSKDESDSLYFFDIDKDTVAKEIVKLNEGSKYHYDGDVIITFENRTFTIYDLKTQETKDISVYNTITDLPKRLVNYCNGYLLYESESGFACCYNFDKSENILLYKLCEDERLWTEYNQDSRLITLTRAFNRQTDNPAFISHKQYMVFDTKTEKLHEITPLFEMSEYCLARNNSSYDNKLVFLHYVKGGESGKTNCVIEYMEFPDSKDEESKKYYVIDSKKRPCSLRSYPMICADKIAYIEESLREEDYTEKIVIFSYEQNAEKGASCEVIYSKQFDGYAFLEGSIDKYSVVVQLPVDCREIGRCGEKPRSYQFDAQKKYYKSLFGDESTIKNHPLICQQTVGNKIILLNRNGGVYYKYTDKDQYALHLGLSNISAYATNGNYCCFYSNNSTVYLALSDNLQKFDKLFDFPSSEVEKMYIKGDYIFLQVRKLINESPFEKRSLVVYNIPKKEKFVVESKDYPILDGAFRGDSLYYIINIGSPGYKFNRHRMIKQQFGDDYQTPVLQVYGYETLKFTDNPYTETLCVQRDLTIGDGNNNPIYESNIYIINSANNSMVEVFQSNQVNNFSLLSYFGSTIAMLYEYEDTFQAKLISAQLGGKTTEQRMPLLGADSGFISVQLTEKYVNLVRNVFTKRDSDYICYSYSP